MCRTKLAFSYFFLSHVNKNIIHSFYSSLRMIADKEAHTDGLLSCLSEWDPLMDVNEVRA